MVQNLERNQTKMQKLALNPLEGQQEKKPEQTSEVEKITLASLEELLEYHKELKFAYDFSNVLVTKAYPEMQTKILTPTEIQHCSSLLVAGGHA